MKKLFVHIAVIIAVLAISAFSQETVYPSGSNVLSTYAVSDTEISIADTLIITRVVTNNESFNLENLYFSENIPSELEVTDFDVSINGTPVSYFLSGPMADYLINGYDTYYWVIDSPVASEGASIVINPGDEVELAITVISDTPGAFSLPFHTTVFNGNGSEYFSTSNAVDIEFLLSVDINDETIDQLPYLLTAKTYPNPFNSAVKIGYLGSIQAGDQINLNLFDILGREIYSNKYSADGNNGEIIWRPDINIGSGVYFYRISSKAESYNGKIIFLK